MYKGDEKIYPFSNIANVGKTELIIPTSVKPGEYYFKITDSKNKDQIVNSHPFTVKRKLPLLLKVAVLAGVGAAVAATVGGASTNKDIPNPLSPTTIH